MGAEGLPEITITFGGGKRVDASFTDFVIPTDQPVTNGGENSAPAPFLYFLASLGTCAGIFVLGFCQNRGLPTEGITLTQRHRLEPGPLPQQLRLAEVAIDIHVPSDFPEKYRDVLVKVAEKCAVKQVIQDPPRFTIQTRVAEGA